MRWPPSSAAEILKQKPSRHQAPRRRGDALLKCVGRKGDVLKCQGSIAIDDAKVICLSSITTRRLVKIIDGGGDEV